jgi:hypothetical protein
MNRFKIGGRILAVAALILGMSVAAQAQLNSNTATVNLSLTVGESLTVSASPATISFVYSAANGGSAAASGPISLVTTAFIGGEYHNITVYGWLSSPSAALTGPSNIPAAEVFSQVNNFSMNTCTQSNGDGIGVAGAGCPGKNVVLDALPVSAAGTYTLTDTVNLSLANLGALLPGTWTGVITFEAQAL